MPTSPAAASAPLPRWAQALVWATAVLAVALPVIATLGTLATAGPDVGILSLGLALSSAALVGALIVTRIPGNVVGWLLLAAGLIFGVNLAGQTYVGASVTDHAGTLPLTSLIAWFDNWSFVVGGRPCRGVRPVVLPGRTPPLAPPPVDGVPRGRDGRDRIQPAAGHVRDRTTRGRTEAS